MAAPEGKIRVLVIEDHFRAAEAMKKFLEVSGFTVHLAHDMKTGLKKAREIEFEVLLCDLHLPDGTGWDLLRKLRKDQPKVRALAFSAFGDQSHLERSRAAGFIEHVVKGAPLAELVAALRRAAAGGEGATRPARQKSSPQ
jgi:DNA-binding response OmpR family regulator